MIAIATALLLVFYAATSFTEHSKVALYWEHR